jgi:hypothetical protein
MRSSENSVKISLLILILFISCSSSADLRCRVEIRVNDSLAVIAVNGFPIGYTHQFVDCKSEPQHVTITAPNKKPFVRMVPGISEFNPKDSYWNVRLLGTSGDQAFTEPIRSARGQAEEILEILEPRLQAMGLSIKGNQVSRSTSGGTSLIVPSVPALPSVSSRPAYRTPAAVVTSRFSDPHRKLTGIYVQVRALPVITKDKDLAIENVNHLAEKLSGTKLTMCPAYVPETKRDWTKILVGPVKNGTVASNLARKYGAGSFVIVDPPCPVRAEDTFRM